MAFQKKTFKLTTTHYKILLTISLLNKQKYYPLSEGVRKILRGEDDPEISQFTNFSTYKTLISYGSKKISRYIMMLYRYHYIEKIYDKNTDKLYLKISDLGESSLFSYNKSHKPRYTKKEKDKIPTIVKIDD